MRGPDGRWRKAGAVFPYPYFDEKQPENDWNQRLTDSPYTGRNYRLFAVLAGVRNDYGIEPIAEPRGVPDDVSKDVLKEYVYEVLDHEPTDDEQEARRCCSAANAERWIRNGSSHWIEKGRILSGPDWHSASWLTLRELLAYDWHRPFGDEGWVSPAQYLEWKRRGRPSAWCKSVGGGGVRHVSHEEMDRLIASKEVDPETEGPMANYYTRVEWGDKPADSCRDFLEGTVPAMLDLIVPTAYCGEARQFLPPILDGRKAGLAPFSDWLQERDLPSLDDVRYTFWFDN